MPATATASSTANASGETVNVPNKLGIPATANTLNVLEEYFNNFSGTVLFVSHDRFFIDSVADMLFVFEGNGKIKKFPGNYSAYHKYLIEKNKNKQNEKPEKKIKQKVKKQNSQKLSFKEKYEFEELENELEILYKEKEELVKYLQSGNYEPEELTEKSKRLPELEKIIDEKEMRWLELSEKI